jgi:hypothetical protein
VITGRPFCAASRLNRRVTASGLQGVPVVLAEHQVVVLPGLPRLQPHLELRLAVLLQQLDGLGRAFNNRAADHD